MVSDGTQQWTAIPEGKAYVAQASPAAGERPAFPKVWVAGSVELMQAWDMRMTIEQMAGAYKSGELLPSQTIVLRGRRYRCHVVHVRERDLKRSTPDYHPDETFWIDENFVVRKLVEIAHPYEQLTASIRLPMEKQTVTTTYPVVDLQPKLSETDFAYRPPASFIQDARLGALPKNVPEPPKATPDIVGTMAPEIRFKTQTGGEVLLSSFKGRPVLIDLWATWCGPCLLSMPALGQVAADAKGTPLTVITADQDRDEATALEYLKRHGYPWANYSDADGSVAKALKTSYLPLTVLIDADGEVVYYDFGGDEAGLRKAIAGLGPAYAAFGVGQGLGKP